VEEAAAAADREAEAEAAVEADLDLQGRIEGESARKDAARRVLQ
jgi:hypothetical protein